MQWYKVVPGNGNYLVLWAACLRSEHQGKVSAVDLLRWLPQHASGIKLFHLLFNLFYCISGRLGLLDICLQEKCLPGHEHEKRQTLLGRPQAIKVKYESYLNLSLSNVLSWIVLSGQNKDTRALTSASRGGSQTTGQGNNRISATEMGCYYQPWHFEMTPAHYWLILLRLRLRLFNEEIVTSPGQPLTQLIRWNKE